MRIKKAILTGGGRATRLHPITTTVNKHLLPLANKPMIFHAIDKVVEAGIDKIYINVNPGETSLQTHIGDGGRWGVNITYFEQTGGPQGIAHVVNEAKKLIGSDPFVFYLSDNILLGSIKPMIDDFASGKHDCMLALSEVPDPQRFGVPVFDEAGKLVDVEEKPENPQSTFAVTGIYLYGPEVFFDAFDHIEKSERGEYEISSVHSHFLKRGMRVGYKEITGWWKDTGKPHDLLLASELLLEQLKDQDLPNHGAVHDNSNITGTVQVGVGAQIGEGVKIIGPVIVGENCKLSHCIIGPNVTLGSGCYIENARIEKSMILENVEITKSIHIVESIIGKGAKIIPRMKKDVQAHRLILGDKTIMEL